MATIGSHIAPKKALALLGLTLVVLYALFQARFLLLGPRITIDSPTEGTVLPQSLTTVEGHAENITFISLDDRPIFLDASGHFEEELLLPQGPSSIIVKARDRFGRETEKLVNVVLQ